MRLQGYATFTNELFFRQRRQKLNVYIRHHQGAKCVHRALAM